jgi:protein TonB
MFDYLAGDSSDKRRAARWTTAVMSALAHGAVVLLLVIPALYATDALPEPEEAIAFFVTVPPPPPPVPAPPPAVLAKPTTRKVAQATPRRAAPARPVAAAPVEAPSEITPETGFEGIASNVVPEAGFEGGVEGGVPGGVVGGLEHALPPPPPLPPRAPVRVGGAITAPRLLHRVPPEYPLIAAQAQIEGVVILEATVGHDGHVDEVKVLRSHSVLDDAAMAAVEQWVYEPLMLNGEPHPFVLTVTVSFSLTR